MDVGDIAADCDVLADDVREGFLGRSLSRAQIVGVDVIEEFAGYHIGRMFLRKGVKLRIEL